MRTLILWLFERLSVILALVGGLLVAFGAFLVYVPAGFVVLGAFLIAFGYVRRALEVLSEVS